MQHITQSMINDIDSFKNKSMINDTSKGITINSHVIDEVADYLVDKFHSPTSRPFYCKVAWKVPRPRIDWLVTTAIEKATMNPGGYFNRLARQELGEV